MRAARAAGCYKVILDCNDDNVDFYVKSGFERKEVHMVCLPDKPPCRHVWHGWMHVGMLINSLVLAGTVFLK